jgi:predicted DNA-binding transcriptional regulator AlpA
MVASSTTPSTFNLLTELEAATRIGISLSTMRRWRRAHTAPNHFRVGGILRYRPEDVDQFIAGHLKREVAR